MGKTKTSYAVPSTAADAEKTDPMQISQHVLSGLRLNDERFRTIYENAPFMIDSFDQNGKVLLWNRACEEQLGYKRAEIEAVADPLAFFYPKAADRDRVVQAIQNPDGKFNEYKVRHRDGRYLDQIWANFSLQDGNFIAVGYDVTAIREAQRKLQAANENLEQHVEARTRELDRERARLISSSKLAALGEMAGGIAHEINNPLAVISGLADQLLAFENGGEHSVLKREMLQDLKGSVERISKIIKGMRCLSRDASRDPKRREEVQDLLLETISICRMRFENQGVSLDWQMPEEPLFVNCRAVEIGQVLLNLLNNALDAVSGFTNKWVRVELTSNEKELFLRVTDSGTGISDSVREKMFRPFFTTKPVGKGTGIGLSISLAIVEAHTGSLHYEPYAGHTSFLVRLPLAR